MSPNHTVKISVCQCVQVYLYLCVGASVGKKQDTQPECLDLSKQMQSWEDLGCVSLSISQEWAGMVANCSHPESRSWERIWEDSMPCWSTAHLGTPAGMLSSPSTALGCGETDGREQSPKPHCCYCHLNSNAFELGRNLYYKVLQLQFPSNLKKSTFCAILMCGFVHFPNCRRCETHLFLMHFGSYGDMPRVGKRNLHWVTIW